MTICRQCQRDPDEYDKFLSEFEMRTAVAEAAANSLGERIDLLTEEVTRLCDRAIWCKVSRYSGDLDSDLDALEAQRFIVERILADIKRGVVTEDLERGYVAATKAIDEALAETNGEYTRTFEKGGA